MLNAVIKDIIKKKKGKKESKQNNNDSKIRAERNVNKAMIDIWVVISEV